MKKRLLSPLPALFILLPLLLVAADPSATHLLYLDVTGHPLQDIDLSGSHVTGTLSADRLPAALNPAAITASGTQLSLRAAAPHDRFLQLADPTAGTEYLTLDALGDGAPVLNLRSAPSLRVRAAAANLFTVWASGGVSVGSTPYDPGAGCLAISQSVSAAGDMTAFGGFAAGGITSLDNGYITTDGVGDVYATAFIAPEGDFDAVNSFGMSTNAINLAGALALTPRSSAPPAPSTGVKLYVDAAGDLRALHANGTSHVISAH